MSSSEEELKPLIQLFEVLAEIDQNLDDADSNSIATEV